MCRWTSVAVAPSATPSRKGGAEAQRINEREKEWARDMRAYKNMRANGIQPRTIDGAAHIEANAEDKFEVEAGHVLTTKEQRQQARDGIALMEQIKASGGAV